MPTPLAQAEGSNELQAARLARIFHTVSANAPPPTTGSSNLGLPDQHPLGLQIPDSMGGARFLSYEFNAG
jgi:hypothetical protein